MIPKIVAWVMVLGLAGGLTLAGGRKSADCGESQDSNRDSSPAGVSARKTTFAHQAWLIKINDRGEILWRRDYPGVAGIASLQRASHGRILAAGAWGGLHKTTGRPWVALLDPEGHPLREHRLEGDGRDSPTGIEGPDGGLVLIGEAWSREPKKTWRVRVERLEPEGRIVWSREFRGLRGKALTATSDGGVLLAGWSTYYSTSKNSVAQVLKLDQAGNPQWIKTIEGPTGDTALSLLEAANGGYLVGGRSGQGGL